MRRKKDLFSKTFSSGGILVVSLVIYNFLNFLFNAILGRALSPEEFGVITLLNTIWTLILIPINSLYSVTNQKVAYLSGSSEKQSGSFVKLVQRKILLFGLGASVLWLALTPFLSSLFKLPSDLVLLSFTPAIILGSINAINRGYLQGSLLFTLAAVSFLGEGGSKLLWALLLIHLNFPSAAYLSVVLSVITTFLITIFLVRGKILKSVSGSEVVFPFKNFNAFLIAAAASTAFVSVDVVMAKIFLDPKLAGEYALLALVGKMIFYLGFLFNIFTITLVSRAIGQGRNPDKIFYLIIGLISLTSFFGFLLLGPFGGIFVPLVFGVKTLPILQFVTLYCLAISSSIITYHLARNHNLFSLVSFAVSCIMAIGLFLHHQGIGQFVSVILVSAGVNLILAVSFHVLYKPKTTKEKSLIEGEFIYE
jgi:O-antigen/teichoic acid export membrane protein